MVGIYSLDGLIIIPSTVCSLKNRYMLCQRKDYVKFEKLPTTQFSPSFSPQHKPQDLYRIFSDVHICKWKMVYIKSNIVKHHWTMGICEVAPLLKGHRLQVTTIDCDSKVLHDSQ